MSSYLIYKKKTAQLYIMCTRTHRHKHTHTRIAQVLNLPSINTQQLKFNIYMSIQNLLFLKIVLITKQDIIFVLF